MNRRSPHGFTLAIALALLSGCFTYTSAPLGTVPAGEEVRVYLTRDAGVELPEEIPADRPYLRGRLMQQEDASLTLRVPIGDRGEGFRRELGQDVRIGTGEVLEIQRRELDVGRSALLVAGGAAIAAAILHLITAEAGSPQPGPGPGPELIRIPLLSIPGR